MKAHHQMYNEPGRQFNEKFHLLSHNFNLKSLQEFYFKKCVVENHENLFHAHFEFIQNIIAVKIYLNDFSFSKTKKHQKYPLTKSITLSLLIFSNETSIACVVIFKLCFQVLRVAVISHWKKSAGFWQKNNKNKLKLQMISKRKSNLNAKT